MHLRDEVLEHSLRNLEVGDDPILQRADSRDVSRGAAQHALSIDPYGGHGLLIVVLPDRHHGGFIEDDPLVPEVDQRVRRPQVDGEISGK